MMAQFPVNPPEPLSSCQQQTKWCRPSEFRRSAQPAATQARVPGATAEKNARQRARCTHHRLGSRRCACRCFLIIVVHVTMKRGAVSDGTAQPAAEGRKAHLPPAVLRASQAGSETLVSGVPVSSSLEVQLLEESEAASDPNSKPSSSERAPAACSSEPAGGAGATGSG